MTKRAKMFVLGLLLAVIVATFFYITPLSISKNTTCHDPASGGVTKVVGQQADDGTTPTGVNPNNPEICTYR